MRLLLTLLLVTLICPALADTDPVSRYTQQQLTISGDTWTLTVPAGLQLQLLTDALDKPRMMNFLANGDLLIGSRAGKIYRLEPPYTRATILVELDDYPHSLAYRAGELLIAQTDGLYRAPYQPGQTSIEEDDIQLLAALPAGGGHNSRTVSIGPDRRVYLSLGISGNCSDEYLDNSYPFDDRRGGILVLDESRSHGHAGKRLLPDCATRWGLTGIRRQRICMPPITAPTTRAMINRPNIFH